MTEIKPKILVVDDEKTNIYILMNLLSDKYRIAVAKDGKQALKIAGSDFAPDLILLDVMMPEMDGFEVCERLKSNDSTKDIPVIFITARDEECDEARGFEIGAVDYLSKPFSPAILTARLQTHLAMANHKLFLENEMKERTKQLLKTQDALRKAMGNLLTIKVCTGVYWLQVPEADLRILCGCPGEVVKLLMRKGLNNPAVKGGTSFETGPNTILLSDLLIQNGRFANLAEFPVLQMLYRQGMAIPGHPNNSGRKPLLIGSADQLKAQLEYIHRGNYGLLSKKEIMAAGIDEEMADIMMRIKLKFAFGTIRNPDQLLDTIAIDEKKREISNGVFVQRIAFNQFRFTYRGEFSDIDLNLPRKVFYPSPYPLPYYRVQRHYFAVVHTGEGDGWNTEHPSMSSLLMFQGRIYLIDASPGVINTLTALGIDISEVEGVFHTHAHDDHFAGLPDLIRNDRRMKYFATPLVRSAVARKFTALMSLDVDKFEQFFEIHDLEFDTWNRLGGLEVMPFYSPHPVETNLFMFRALDGDGYKTYAHWADLSSFEVLEGMAGNGENDIPLSFIEKVKASYLSRADLKKLDVGGGLIHGAARDFITDTSGRLILSHCNRTLTTEEMEIGSETSFGAIDILIPGEQDHFRQRSFYYLKELFPESSNDEIRMLINGKMKEYNAGSIVRRNDDTSACIEMIIAGKVLYLNATRWVHNHLRFGSFMGLGQIFCHTTMDDGIYRAFSHAATIEISPSLFKIFLENNGIFETLGRRLKTIEFLRSTWLFGEQTSFVFLDKLSKSIETLLLKDREFANVAKESCLWLIYEGVIEMMDAHGGKIDKLVKGAFFGEHNYLANVDLGWRFQARGDCQILCIPWDKIVDAPIILWKLLEINQKRIRLSSVSRAYG
ncbi:Cyclic nucleotide-binding protein [Desulfamplus magnetovallimortis]|uniref:Cyclic nucleotide-binding protein n=1 Tax=Desulfamplus magnetovallimortis TaxID=1246637 RepID=A0A1W1H8Z2_9BACT|nr:response regulator [Desulfamplus magnetovallimortis]SLM28919.1 Cyclic nucleotide-binding protein [Desulfamplus magnetovallimortis]